jgi:hypothetical protein
MGLTLEGIGAQLNRSSGDYGSGYIGRLGLLGLAVSRKVAVIVKIDPITEEIERRSDGLCIPVAPRLIQLTGRLEMGDRGNYYSLWILKGSKIRFVIFRGITTIRFAQTRRLHGMYF